jgi:hypothetical protein
MGKPQYDAPSISKLQNWCLVGKMSFLTGILRKKVKTHSPQNVKRDALTREGS